MAGRIRGMSLLHHARKVDANLLKALQSEINHELSFPSAFSDVEQCGSVGDFKIEWDKQVTQDILMRRKCPSGEELVISALLGQPEYNREVLLFPRRVDFKVCVKKESIIDALLLDCSLSEIQGDGVSLDIRQAAFFPVATSLMNSLNFAPEYWRLNDKLKKAFKQYLESNGINKEVREFILLHMHRKEESQYLDWLQKLKSMFITQDSNK